MFEGVFFISSFFEKSEALHFFVRSSFDNREKSVVVALSLSRSLFYSPPRMPPSTDSSFYGVYLLNSRAVPNSKRTYIG